MMDRARRFLHGHPKLVWDSGVGLVVLVVVALLAIWDSGYECVRWSSRINIDEHGNVSTTRVCAEWRPRWGPNVGK